MLKVLITCDEHPAIFDLPHDRSEVGIFLAGVGFWNPYADLRLFDDEKMDAVQVKLIAETPVDNHLQLLFAEDAKLSTVNTVCDLFYRLPIETQIDLTHNIADGKINSERDLLDAIKEIKVLEAQNKSEDKFYLNSENESLRWLYFNPDSSAGGQYVEIIADFSLIREAAAVEDDFFGYLEGVSKGYLTDIDTEGFALLDDEFDNKPYDFKGCTDTTKTALISAANAGLVETHDLPAITFSRVKLWTDNGEEDEFYMPGIPKSNDDFDENDEFEDFVNRISTTDTKEITAYVTTFSEGGVFGQDAGKTQLASQADIDRIYNAIADVDIDTITGWNFVSESQFSFDFDIDELFNMKNGSGMTGIE